MSMTTAGTYNYDAIKTAINPAFPAASIPTTHSPLPSFQTTTTCAAFGITVWLSRDPVGELGGLNLFVLSHNNSINRVDFFGLADCLPWLFEGFDWVPTGEIRDVEYSFPSLTLIQIFDPTLLSNLFGSWYEGVREVEDELNARFVRFCISCLWKKIHIYKEIKSEPTGIKRWRRALHLYYRGELINDREVFL